jgi:putative transport protein
MPPNTHLFFPEVGIALFFAAVFSAPGLEWLPAGSMTAPPAFAFASNVAGSDAPTVAEATVHPPTTLLRIVSAQILATVLFK